MSFTDAARGSRNLVVVQTPLRFDSWIPDRVRREILRGLPDGAHRFDPDIVVWSVKVNGATIVEAYRELPESGADPLLASTAAEWNRDMRKLVFEDGLAPSVARSILRELYADLLSQTLEAVAMFYAGMGHAGVGLRAEPSAPFSSSRVAPNARAARIELARDRPTGARGPSSGRDFDPERAGGPIRPLEYEGVRITDRGIDVVEAHVRRFQPPGEEELAMLHRLREIAAGKRVAEAVDRRFYTHELRESVRYRRLGYSGREPADADVAYEVWNNAHTATLEEYGLKDGAVLVPLGR